MSRGFSAKAVRDLEELSEILSQLAASGHDRLTVKQALFFATVAHAHAMGHSITLTDVMTKFSGTDSLGGAIRKSYGVFLPVRDGLGWIVQEENPEDRRIKFLKLTDKGLHVVKALFD